MHRSVSCHLHTTWILNLNLNLSSNLKFSLTRNWVKSTQHTMLSKSRTYNAFASGIFRLKTNYKTMYYLLSFLSSPFGSLLIFFQTWSTGFLQSLYFQGGKPFSKRGKIFLGKYNFLGWWFAWNIWIFRRQNLVFGKESRIKDHLCLGHTTWCDSGWWKYVSMT